MLCLWQNARCICPELYHCFKPTRRGTRENVSHYWKLSEICKENKNKLKFWEIMDKSSFQWYDSDNSFNISNIKLATVYGIAHQLGRLSLFLQLLFCLILLEPCIWHTFLIEDWYPRNKKINRKYRRQTIETVGCPVQICQTIMSCK